MSFADEQLSRDDFLGGALRIRQPLQGYRAATDPVFLAAAVPARAGQSVLELGCGAGVALACLCRRVEGLQAHGLELQADYAELAERNARDNGLEMTIHQGDLLVMPAALRALGFDHVFANPPFYPRNAASGASDRGRDTAHREGEAGLADWITAGLRRLKPRGYFTMIHRSERLVDILAGLQGRAGDIRILPLVPRAGQDARRVIVQARKGAAGPLRLLSPLVLHKGVAHEKDEDSFNTTIRKVLREIQPIVL